MGAQSAVIFLPYWARRTTVVILALFALATPTFATEFPLCGSGKRVTCVIDGDTFWLKGEKIRPEGFDAPEMGAPRCARKAPLADAAAAELARVLSSGRVAIEEGGRSYDRRLARVTVDGVDIAEPMIASGLARPYVPGSAPWCE